MQHSRRKFINNAAKLTTGEAFTSGIAAPLLEYGKAFCPAKK